MLRRAAVASSSAAALAVGAASVDDDARRSLTMGTVGAVCRTFMRGQGALTVHDEHHLRAGLARPAGVAMLSVSNHIATVDDPHLLASIVPPSTLVRPGAMRWGVCAHDVCFRPGSLLQRWADSAQVLPVRSCLALGYGAKIICLGGSTKCHPSDAAGLQDKREEAAAYMHKKAECSKGGSKKKANKSKTKVSLWLPDNPILELGYEAKRMSSFNHRRSSKRDTAPLSKEEEAAMRAKLGKKK